MDAHDLYGLALERFVPERDALAKSLRKEGKRDDASAVAALRKPSVAAWAVNQLVRTQRSAASELFKAGDSLQRAQAELLRGKGDPAALRRAVTREREVVTALAEKAQGLLSSEGQELTPATRERVSDTLHAAALDREARVKVKDGCLHRELRHVGLGEGLELGATPTRTKSSVRSTPKRTDRDRAARLRAAKKAEGDARRLADRTARELKSAIERRDRIADSLQEAEAALASARKRAEEATLAHREAQRELERD
jgi:hypothetical protein